MNEVGEHIKKEIEAIVRTHLAVGSEEGYIPISPCEYFPSALAADGKYRVAEGILKPLVLSRNPSHYEPSLWDDMWSLYRQVVPRQELVEFMLATGIQSMRFAGKEILTSDLISRRPVNSK